MVNYLANCKLIEEWQFGKEPYSRANPPPTVCSPCLFFSLFDLLPSSFWPTLTSRLVFDRALFFGLQAGRTRSADSSPTGRSTIWRTPTWGRPLWTTTPRRAVAKPAAKQAAPGMELASMTGRTTTRPKSSRAVSRRLAAARVPPLHRLLGAAGKSVVPRRVCSVVGRRSPEAGQRRLGRRRRPRRRPASARR